MTKVKKPTLVYRVEGGTVLDDLNHNLWVLEGDGARENWRFHKTANFTVVQQKHSTAMEPEEFESWKSEWKAECRSITLTTRKAQKRVLSFQVKQGTPLGKLAEMLWALEEMTLNFSRTWRIRNMVNLNLREF